MRRILTLGITLLVAAAAGCDSDISGEGNGRVTVLLTDAPGDVSKAVVTISSIYLQGGEDPESDGDDGDSGRLYLRTDPITTDLLTLRDDAATIVDEAVVPSGRYGQLRFVLSGAYLEVEADDGVRVFATAGYDEAPSQVDGTLVCPSCAQSGLKVVLTEEVVVADGESATVLVDFDVAQSFGKEAGGSGRWVMHPTITAERMP